MKYFAGLDVLLEETSIRVVEETGRALRELRATSEPEALVAASWETDSKLERAGLEAGTLTAWLQERLTQARLFACLVK